MPGTECGPLHNHCRPYQSIWHSQSRGILENYGKIWLSCQIHSNGTAVPWWYACKVKNDGKFSDPFPVTNGVKPGCVLASTMFSMMFSVMLTWFQDDGNSIPIRYRFDVKLFNIRRLQAKSKVQTEVLDEFLFADYMTKPSRNVHSGKPELRHHQLIFLPQTSLVLSATGNLKLRLVWSATFKHNTNNNTSCIWLGLVIVSNDRRKRQYIFSQRELPFQL